MTRYTLDDLENNVMTSIIKWRVPVPVSWPGKKVTWACRVCIANHGLNIDSPHQWSTMDEAHVHIAVSHT
jgi:hypothetical protein